MTLNLTATEQEMLSGSRGGAVAMSMRVICEVARIKGATELVDVKNVHIDSCLYHGKAGLDFAERLIELGGKTIVPTTVNVGSVDLLHPELILRNTEHEQEVYREGRKLMDAYIKLGTKETWTCAPYQFDSRPEVGEHIAWAESNAIVFANSVLGARTDRYGDFLDIASAITGKAPKAGLHLDENRYGEVVFDCSQISDQLLNLDLTYPVLGYLAGKISGTANPVFIGIPTDVSEDRLKALGAAAASSGGVALFHVVGRTPEAPDLPTALGENTDTQVHVLSNSDIKAGRAELSTITEAKVDAVSLGTPHASLAEVQDLANELLGNTSIHPDVKFYISTGRTVYQTAQELGLAQSLEEVGVIFVLDTCTYVTSILKPGTKVVITNSGKWAHYAPGNLDVSVVLGTLAECVKSAQTGQITLDQSLFDD